MYIKQLEYFIAVSEQLNFTKAAKQFYISQTAISLQIKALEDEMGVQLFNRTNRKVELTPAGKSFVEDARAILRRTRDGMERAQRADTVFTGEINIGYVKGFEKTDLSDVLADFHVKYPNISMTFTRDNVSELYDSINNGSMDIAINILYTNRDEKDFTSMEYMILGQYQLMAVVPASHPLAHRTSITRNDLKDYPLVDIRKENRYGEIRTIMNAFRRSGFEPKVQYVSDDIETSLLAVAVGFGYALLPTYITNNIPMREKVIALPIEGEEKEMTIVAVWNTENRNPALQKFIDNCIRPAVENERFKY